VIKMMGYLETLDKLGCEFKDDLATNVILQSLLASYEPFILNYHMNGMVKTMVELHGMLKTVDDSIKKTPQSCDDGSKGEEKDKELDASQGKRLRTCKKSNEPSSSKSKTLLLMRNASTAIRRDIGSKIVRST
jgi:hypothetical protein